jgi:hypothetical protein
MITIKLLTSIENGYETVAEVDETDATVYGDGVTADRLRASFDRMRSHGYDPADHIDGIRDRLLANWNNVYYVTILT